ncbi:LuxR C-terminal-related transcriptional regulator [Polyangium sp. 15x6]|uniref:response regulator transcription factor n=1 Tax=Polyangium sp. 15x6 TaxID=3042687 RepID=UPI00249C9BEA|nr:LuxR C-terminal-related transcriptional regulator [Polyangium sp. 15x6]MDI3283820.1 LuxR C-terminal-related transcriptional regulator [Polyangium sp. 15x6]
MHHVANGHSNKLIAYELGIPEGTVATHIRSIRMKLGVRSRTELVDRYLTLRDAEVSEFSIFASRVMIGAAEAASPDAASLTPSECDVASMAARGMSNARIAAGRRCSTRTVANQLASVYRKLGVSSRAELSAPGFHRRK